MHLYRKLLFSKITLEWSTCYEPEAQLLLWFTDHFSFFPSSHHFQQHTWSSFVDYIIMIKGNYNHEDLNPLWFRGKFGPITHTYCSIYCNFTASVGRVNISAVFELLWTNSIETFWFINLGLYWCTLSCGCVGRWG